MLEYAHMSMNTEQITQSNEQVMIAWMSMLAADKLGTYLQMSVADLNDLWGRLRKGKRPKKGEREIAQYLGALDVMNTTQPKGQAEDR